MKHDLIGIVESAYDLDGSDGAWLARVAGRVRPHIDQGLGVVAWFMSATASGVTTSDYVCLGAPQSFADDIRIAHENLIPGDVEASYGRHVSFGYGSRIMTTPIWNALWARAPQGLRRGWVDCLCLIPQDPWGNGLLLSALTAKPGSARPSNSATWPRIAAHLSAALRLRRLLRMKGLTQDQQAPEAILTPDGKTAHAEGQARTRDARADLREAAVSVDRARGRLRTSNPTAAIRLWRGMVRGRWSLVDRFEANGRRFLLAYRNTPALAEPRRLTPGERQVLGFASMGHSNKSIAYELGLSVGTVTSMAASIRRRMGARSQAEIIEVAARLAGPGSKAPGTKG